MHRVGKLSEARVTNGVFDGQSAGLARRILIGDANGSPHQALVVVDLAPEGRVNRHLQAYEEAIYVLDGALSIDIAGRVESLVANDYCFIEKGTPHAIVNESPDWVRWLELTAPQPGSDMIEDTVFAADATVGEPASVGFQRGHFDPDGLPEPSSVLGLDGFGVANVGGASLEVLVNQEFGASQFHLMVVEYAPGGFITEHDHAFEEAFFFVSGEIEAVLDGDTYTLAAGDYCWSGIRSRHALTNRGDAPVRWIETQVPQPPSRHQARFRSDWARLLGTAD